MDQIGREKINTKASWAEPRRVYFAECWRAEYVGEGGGGQSPIYHGMSSPHTSCSCPWGAGTPLNRHLGMKSYSSTTSYTTGPVGRAQERGCKLSSLS